MLARWLLRGVAGLGLTVLRGSSSQLPGSRRRAGGVKAGAPAAAQWRGRTSLRPASGDGSWEAGKIGVRAGCEGRVVPGRGWRSGLASTHPAPPTCGAAAMTMCPGNRAAQSDDRARRWRRLMPKERAHPGLGDPPGLGCAAVAVLASGAAGPGAWASASRCQARVSSLREIAMVAILVPRRLAMAA